MADKYVIRVPALEVAQGSRRIYCFAIDGKRIHEFATVSRIHRNDGGSLTGYQRPEVLSHIRAIRRYVESTDAMLPNSIVVAFDSRVTFEPAIASGAAGYSIPGELVIPVDETLAEEDKPALVVDGQQRSAAIRDADVAEFPVAVVGFIANSDDEQRSQFILVNNTKPLPKGLIHELLPDSIGALPPQYARRKLPAEVMIRLNRDPEGPFYNKIAMPTSPHGDIKDNTVLKMIENSLYDGALYQYRDPRDGSGDVDRMVVHLTAFWKMVESTWPVEWLMPPRKSRLTHGVGIQALGYVMDHLTEGIAPEKFNNIRIDRSLATIRDIAAWTEGTWDLGPDDQRRWNSLQNTPNDVKLLTSALLRRVRAR
ncbi:DGQHR domain-containing protein DpdB [Lolliginicoccus suaedae]|uniref:DGQHR domain-containing protein DpdB n=1 Tax=Lolliginicoccus suaedae TaxID=2605429 RepID=UPI0011ECDFF6|nr:DGQHR domain-containing protein DpdB [Lolliginicoccus suaedae]